MPPSFWRLINRDHRGHSSGCRLYNYVSFKKRRGSRWFNVTFSSPSWRSPTTIWKGHGNSPSQKGHELNHQDIFRLLFRLAATNWTNPDFPDDHSIRIFPNLQRFDELISCANPRELSQKELQISIDPWVVSQLKVSPSAKWIYSISCHRLQSWPTK